MSRGLVLMRHSSGAKAHILYSLYVGAESPDLLKKNRCSCFEGTGRVAQETALLE